MMPEVSGEILGTFDLPKLVRSLSPINGNSGFGDIKCKNADVYKRRFAKLGGSVPLLRDKPRQQLKWHTFEDQCKN